MLRSSSAPAKVASGIVRNARIAVIRAEYNAEITESLERKCLETLRESGVSVDCFTVPGCLEIPIFAQRLARRRRYDVMIALGAVIRGDTHHFELVASECARGIMEVSLKYNVPIIFEVLAVYRRRDAVARAGNNARNKGVEAANAALSMLSKIHGLA